MNLLRINHTRKHDKSTHRERMNHELTKDFKVIQAGTESGITIEAKYIDYTWTVTLSPEETNSVIQSLLKKS